MNSSTPTIPATTGVKAMPTNKYSKEFPIPPELPDILRDLTREVLRNQPRDINKFASEFFANELHSRQLPDDENA